LALEFLLVLVVLSAAVLIIAGPLRAPRGGNGAGEGDAHAEGVREALEAAKEAKYREIRDTEVDFRTGKLSEADWRETDAALRAEAIDILRRLDELG
jgi:hypothetical protein